MKSPTEFIWDVTKYSEDVLNRCNASSMYIVQMVKEGKDKHIVSITRKDNNNVELDDFVAEIDDVKTRIILESKFHNIRELVVNKALAKH